MSNKRAKSARVVQAPISNQAASPAANAAVKRSQRLVALPVPGDAFLLERNAKTVLVDGGINGVTLYEQLQEELGKEPALLRVICTHNDSDHAQGLATMLADRSNAMALGEVWLPGSWADPLFEAMTDPAYFVDKVVESVVRALCEQDNNAKKNNLRRALDVLMAGRDISEIEVVPRERRKAHDMTRKASDARKQQVRMAVEAGLDHWARLPPRVSQYSRSDVTRDVRVNGCRHMRSEDEINAAIVLCQYLIKAGERIVKIADGAIGRGAELRWFDAQSYYDECSRRAEGGDADLRPLNSKELLVPPDGPVDLGDLLFLTVANRHSLVFWAPETDQAPGTVFSGDGLLDGDQIVPPPGKVVAVTAPHHGSATNAPVAYNNLAKMLGRNWHDAAIMVRSDRYVKINPCDDYKTTTQRLCTVCPHRDKRHRTVILRVDPKRCEWDFPKASKLHKCDCA